MPDEPSRGYGPRARLDASPAQESGDPTPCARCDASADGLDARRREPICRSCADSPLPLPDGGRLGQFAASPSRDNRKFPESEDRDSILGRLRERIGRRRLFPEITLQLLSSPGGDDSGMPESQLSDSDTPAGHSDATPGWRLRWHVGDLAHHTEWTTDFGTVENLYDQYRRSDVFPGHDIVIERRTVVRDHGGER
jgi:hypothetical protein